MLLFQWMFVHVWFVTLYDWEAAGTQWYLGVFPCKHTKCSTMGNKHICIYIFMLLLHVCNRSQALQLKWAWGTSGWSSSWEYWGGGWEHTLDTHTHLQTLSENLSHLGTIWHCQSNVFRLWKETQRKHAQKLDKGSSSGLNVFKLSSIQKTNKNLIPRRSF